MIPDSHRDLLDAPNVAVVTTLGKDGYAQSTAVFFDFTGGVLRISITADRAKYRNLVRDPRLTFFLLDPKNPYRSLEVRGTVTLEDDVGYVFRDQVGKRYAFDGSKIDGPDTRRIKVTIHPTKVNAR